jgi:hypothetical protein
MKAQRDCWPTVVACQANASRRDRDPKASGREKHGFLRSWRRTSNRKLSGVGAASSVSRRAAGTAASTGVDPVGLHARFGPSSSFFSLGRSAGATVSR